MDDDDIHDRISLSMGHELVISRDILDEVMNAGEFSVQPPSFPPPATQQTCTTAVGTAEPSFCRTRTSSRAPELEVLMSSTPIDNLQATDFQLDGVFAVTEQGAHSLQPVPVRAGLEWRMYGTPEIGLKWRQVLSPARVPLSLLPSLPGSPPLHASMLAAVGQGTATPGNTLFLK